MGKVEKAHELRKKDKDYFLKTLDELKAELAHLRVTKVSGHGGPAKLTQIKVVRKQIARVLTVFNQKVREAGRKQYRKKEYKPIDFRVKKTRAIRRRLTSAQTAKKTLKQAKKDQYFPQRKFALKAFGSK